MVDRIPLGLLVLVAALAACGPPAGRLFTTTLTTPDGSYPTAVTLGDQTDLVVAIEPGIGDPSSAEELEVQTAPSEPDVLIVRWIGSACEPETQVSFRRDGAGYVLIVAGKGGSLLPGGCPAIALYRVLRIATTEPVEPHSITLHRFMR